MEWTHPDKELFEKKKADFDFNFEIIKERIAEAAKISGREQKDIKLLAATKTVSPELINYGLEKGIELIGENRVQELLSKKDELNTDKEHTHFIGHLQTNKINMLLPHVSMIESVGSIHLAEEISKKCIAAGTVMPVLMEVNVGEEISKSGARPKAPLSRCFLSAELRSWGLCPYRRPVKTPTTQEDIFRQFTNCLLTLRTKTEIIKILCIFRWECREIIMRQFPRAQTSSESVPRCSVKEYTKNKFL